MGHFTGRVISTTSIKIKQFQPHRASIHPVALQSTSGTTSQEQRKKADCNAQSPTSVDTQPFRQTAEPMNAGPSAPSRSPERSFL